MEDYHHIHDNYTFKMVFLRVTCPEDFYAEYVKNVPLIKSIQERIEQEIGITFLELFDQHYQIWQDELSNNPSDIFSYIKKDLIDAENEIKPQNEFEKKSLYLAAKHVLLFSVESLQKGLYNTNNRLGNDTVFIDEKTVFHIIWGHYIRFPYLNLKERNKSIFTEHSDLSFINEIESICKTINDTYVFTKDKEVLSFKIGNHYYRLVVEKVEDVKYRVVTFFKIHKDDEINKLYSQCTQVQLNNDFILFKTLN